jgi:uncharacterized repeat protein (TIGR01451 family)
VYSYLVTNSGNVTLTSVGITDSLSGLSAVTCPAITLAAGASLMCSATYTITAADLSAGQVTNTATDHGTPPGSLTPVVSGPATTVVLAEKPAITLVKSAKPAIFDRPGQVITYSYRVTNSGNVTLASVGITDRRPGLRALTCPAKTLAAGATETCTARYVTTAADLDAGKVVNTATAHGTPPSPATPVVSRPSTVTVRAVPKPAITVRKSATPAFFDRPGQVVRYSYRVTNTGNVTLSHVAVRDGLRGLSAVSCPRATLAARAAETCTATYRITSADLKAGFVRNRAVAKGYPPRWRRPVISPASAVTIFGRVPVTGLGPTRTGRGPGRR